MPPAARARFFSFSRAERGREAFSGLYEILPHLLFISLRSADLLLTGLTPSLGSHGGGLPSETLF